MGEILSEYATADDLKKWHFPTYVLPPNSYLSICMTESMVLELKTRANSIDIPYQALIKKYFDGVKRDGALSIHEPGKCPHKIKKAAKH